MLTDENLEGQFTNSDFELAATVLHEAVLGHYYRLHTRTIRTGSDNVPTVAWRNKGSTTTQGPAAYLLRAASLLQRQHGHVRRIHYLPGTANILADAASRRFDLSSPDLIKLLSLLAPQPSPWRDYGCRPLCFLQ